MYINNSLHLVRKYAGIFVRGHYLFRETNSFPRVELEENCELLGRTRHFDVIRFHLLSITVNRFSNLQLLLVVFDEIVKLIRNKLISEY